MSDDENSSLSEFEYEFDDGEDEVDNNSMADSDFEITSNARAKRGATGRKRGRIRKDKGANYTIKNALKAPRATTYTVQALFDQIVNGDIDLDPEYQRDVVWPEAKQVGLLDSIFRNFYIPPVIFSVNSAEDGSETRTCIDGKQRLTSIYRFMLGLIYHRDRLTGDKYWYKDTAASERKRRKLLPEKYRRLFANKQIVCVEYGEIGDRDEREIFQRVQLGMALTPAEKLSVLKSPRADFVRELQSTFFKDASSALSSLSWDRSRGSDFRCLATILWCIDRYYTSPSGMTNPGSMPQLESFLNNQKQDLPRTFRENVKKAFQTFEEMVASDDDAISGPFRMSASDFSVVTKGGPVKKNDKVSPIEFICICLLILVWREKMSLPAMAASIRDMRMGVRSEHVDVRMNTRVGKTMILFLKDIKPEEYEAIVGKAKSNGKNAASPKKHKSTDNTTTGVKRKRVQEDDAASASDASMLDKASTARPLSKNSKMRTDTPASICASPVAVASAARKTTGGLATLRKVTMDYQGQAGSQKEEMD